MLYAFLTYLYFTFQGIIDLLGTALILYIVVFSIMFVVAGIHYSFEVSVTKSCKDYWAKENGMPCTFSNYLKTGILPKIFYPKATIALLLLLQLFPSQETIKWVAGAYVTGETVSYISNNEQAKELPNNVLEAANTFLKSVDGETITNTVDKLPEVVKDSKTTVKEALETLTPKQKEAVFNLINNNLTESK